MTERLNPTIYTDSKSIQIKTIFPPVQKTNPWRTVEIDKLPKGKKNKFSKSGMRGGEIHDYFSTTKKLKTQIIGFIGGSRSPLREHQSNEAILDDDEIEFVGVIKRPFAPKKYEVIHLSDDEDEDREVQVVHESHDAAETVNDSDNDSVCSESILATAGPLLISQVAREREILEQPLEVELAPGNGLPPSEVGPSSEVGLAPGNGLPPSEVGPSSEVGLAPVNGLPPSEVGLAPGNGLPPSEVGLAPECVQPSEGGHTPDIIQSLAVEQFPVPVTRDAGQYSEQSKKTPPFKPNCYFQLDLPALQRHATPSKNPPARELNTSDSDSSVTLSNSDDGELAMFSETERGTVGKRRNSATNPLILSEVTNSSKRIRLTSYERIAAAETSKSPHSFVFENSQGEEIELDNEGSVDIYLASEDEESVDISQANDKHMEIKTETFAPDVLLNMDTVFYCDEVTQPSSTSDGDGDNSSTVNEPTSFAGILPTSSLEPVSETLPELTLHGAASPKSPVVIGYKRISDTLKIPILLDLKESGSSMSALNECGTTNESETTSVYCSPTSKRSQKADEDDSNSDSSESQCTPTGLKTRTCVSLAPRAHQNTRSQPKVGLAAVQNTFLNENQQILAKRKAIEAKVAGCPSKMSREVNISFYFFFNFF